MTRPSVSIVTPTGKREALLRLQHADVLRQTVQDFEWLVLDDSPEPSKFFTGLTDPRIRYRHHAGPRLSIGTKRNQLIAEARADVIVHFDDDDFYAANYLEVMTGRLNAADAVKLSGFFVYSLFSEFLGYWDTKLKHGLHYKVSAATGITVMDFGPVDSALLSNVDLGFGFCHAYRRSVWEKAPFPDQDIGEDRVFLTQAQSAGLKLDMFADTGGLVLHIIRHDNVSQCWPQYRLPDFLLEKIFGPAVKPMTGR